MHFHHIFNAKNIKWLTCVVGGNREEIGSVARDDVCNGNELDADCNGYDCVDD